MRNLKRLLFILKILGLSILIMVVIGFLLVKFSILFLVLVVVMFFYSLWFISDDFIK
jgi:hypothetical protein